MKKNKVIAICGMVFILFFSIYSFQYVFIGDSWQTDTNSAENELDNSVMSEYVADVCDAVKDMDFTIRESRLDITSEEDRLYKEAYLKMLKNEMPILEWEKQYYKDLRGAGIPFEDLLERRMKSQNLFFRQQNMKFPQEPLRKFSGNYWNKNEVI